MNRDPGKHPAGERRKSRVAKPEHENRSGQAAQEPSPALGAEKSRFVRPVLDLEREADRVLWERSGYAGLVVNDELQVLHFRGDTSAYLRIAPGRASLELNRMLRKDLWLEVRAAIDKVRQSGNAVRGEPLQIDENGETHEVRVEVRRLVQRKRKVAKYYLVLFEKVGHPSEIPPQPAATGSRAHPEIRSLESELARTKDHLRALIREQETVNDALRAANEEAVSTNEELQATNVELEMAQEELRSSNEELLTLNERAQIQNGQLVQLTDELKQSQEALRKEGDFVAAVLEAAKELLVVALDSEGRIVRFNPTCQKLTGYSLDEVKGRILWDFLLLREEVDRVKAVFAELFSGKQVQSENYWVTKTGHRVLISWSASSTVNDAGTVEFILHTGVNVTERHRAEQRFRVAVESAPNCIVMADQEGKMVLVNAQTEKLFGYEREELLGKPVEVLVPESYRLGHPGLRAGYLAQPQVRYIGQGRDLHAQRKDGTQFPVEIGLNPVETAQGTWVLSSIVDISERRRAENALREALQQRRIITDNMPAFVTRCSRDLGYVWVSPSYAAFLGRTSDEIVGRPILEVLGHEAYRVLQPHIEKVLSGEKAEYEHQVTFPGAGPRWVQTTYVPTKGQDGQIDGWIAVITDVTERHEAEDRLRESEERFRTLANTAPVMIWVSGPDKLCTFFNKGWLVFTGRTMEQELGDGWSSGVHPDDLERCLSIYNSSFDARQDFRMEYRLRRADGDYRWILYHGVPLFAPGGVFRGYIGSALDITDLKNSQEEALRKQKLESVGVLAAGIAHDFNNLLGSIVADTDLALSEMDAGSLPIEELQGIRTVAFRASEIVRELMVYSGHEAAADFEPVHLSVLVKDMVELLKVSVPKHVTFKADFEKNLPPVKGHAPQIRQVVMNLIINASEAIGENHGTITVSAARGTGGKDVVAESTNDLGPGEYVRLEVSDTGCGMTEEQTRKIFDPFFTTKFAGRGLGLAVVHGVVRTHGGGINVRSAPGRGTTFQVYFPCWADAAKPEESAKAVATPEPISSAIGTVLVVEDEDILRRPIVKVLRKERFSVIEAADGTAAIDLLRAHASEIDLILLDLTIPGATSREVAEEAQRIRPGIKLVVTSAHSQEVALQSIRLPQAFPFLRKPFRLPDLVGLLQETLSSPVPGTMWRRH